MARRQNSSEALVHGLEFEAAKSASCYINEFVPSHCRYDGCRKTLLSGNKYQYSTTFKSVLVRYIYRAIQVITVYFQVVISEVLRFIIGWYNYNNWVLILVDILLRVNNFHLICCKDSVVNYELFNLKLKEWLVT